MSKVPGKAKRPRTRQAQICDFGAGSDQIRMEIRIDDVSTKDRERVEEAVRKALRAAGFNPDIIPHVWGGTD